MPDQSKMCENAGMCICKSFAGQGGGKILTTEKFRAAKNDQINLELRAKLFENRAMWQKVDENVNGWIKLRHLLSGLFLHLDEEGGNLSLQHDANPPCHGRQPCLR